MYGTPNGRQGAAYLARVTPEQVRQLLKPGLDPAAVQSAATQAVASARVRIFCMIYLLIGRVPAGAGARKNNQARGRGHFMARDGRFLGGTAGIRARTRRSPP